MKTYATLGPACCRADLLTELLDMGLTGFRLNLSHTTLAACRPWTEAVQQARAASGRPAEACRTLPRSSFYRKCQIKKRRGIRRPNTALHKGYPHYPHSFPHIIM